MRLVEFICPPARAIVFAAIAATAAGCSSDITRFSDNPLGNPYAAGHAGAGGATASPPQSTAGARVEAKPLAQPASAGAGRTAPPQPTVTPPAVPTAPPPAARGAGANAAPKPTSEAASPAPQEVAMASPPAARVVTPAAEAGGGGPPRAPGGPLCR